MGRSEEGCQFRRAGRERKGKEMRNVENNVHKSLKKTINVAEEYAPTSLIVATDIDTSELKSAGASSHPMIEW